jgi:hypothetical protein
MDKIIPIDITEIIKGAMENKQMTIHAHYGMSEKDFDNLWKDMLCDMLKSTDKNVVLDKWFKDGVPMNEMRLRVIAYARANEMLDKMMD